MVHGQRVDHERFGAAIICPSFELGRTWCGQIVCGVWIVSALTASSAPWFFGRRGLGGLKPSAVCVQDGTAKGNLGVWKVSVELRKR